MRANRGFTLLELMIAVAIALILAGMIVWQGRSARQNARMAGGAYELALRIGGLRGRAMADGLEYVLVVADTDNPDACAQRDADCGRVFVARKPDPTFPTVFQASWNPDVPTAHGQLVDDGPGDRIVRNARFDLESVWRPPAPFASVAPFDANIVFTCAGGRRCFALRFLPDGEVRPVIRQNVPVPAGFTFVLRPIDKPSAAAERRAIFVSFPTGIVKTGAY